MITRTSGSDTNPSRQCPPLVTDETPSFPHRLLYGGYHLFGRADSSDVVRARAEPLIETLIDHREIPRIVGADSDGFDSRAVQSSVVSTSSHFASEGQAFSFEVIVRTPSLSMNQARGAAGKLARFLQNPRVCWLSRYTPTFEP